MIFDKCQFIECNPDKCGGYPVIKGTRILLSRIIAELADGRSLHDIIDSFHLNPLDVLGALNELAYILGNSSSDKGGKDSE